MSNSVSLELPDDVAERLARAADANEYVTNLVRRHMEAERITRALLAEHGMPVTDEGVARARARLQSMGKMDPQLREELRQLGRLT